MTRIIRKKRLFNLDTDDYLPAGEVFDFENDCDVISFLKGKSINNYLVFKNGYGIILHPDSKVIEKRLKDVENVED